MDVKQAKEYFNLGVVTGFEVVRSPMSIGWLLSISTKGKTEGYILQTALKKDKIYSSLDTLASELEKITGRVSGFSVKV